MNTLMRLILVMAVVVISSAILQTAHASSKEYVPKCSDKCVNTTNNSLFDKVCKAATADGKKGCEALSENGCEYKKGQLIVWTTATCMNIGTEEVYDSLCEKVTANGQKGCEKYSRLGCAWIPAKYKCR